MPPWPLIFLSSPRNRANGSPSCTTGGAEAGLAIRGLSNSDRKELSTAPRAALSSVFFDREPQARRPAARFVAVALFLALLFSLPAEAAKKKRPRHAAKPPSTDVQPSADIDARVAFEVDRAKQIVGGLDTDNLLASPYLVSVVYYHDGFLSTFPADRSSADPERRIVGQISNMATPLVKAKFIDLLHEIWNKSDQRGSPQLRQPLTYFVVGASSRTHRYAIDLFTSEGAPVYSVSRGIVVLADRGWDPADLFSTSSRKGGNAVIVFDPDRDRFYRYCHLSTVLVTAGDLVRSGEVVGKVGHTGFNASLPGHGRHLHFEVNEYVDGHVRAMDHKQLRAMLASWPSVYQADADAAQTPHPIR